MNNIESSTAYVDPAEWTHLQLQQLCKHISTEQIEASKSSIKKFDNAVEIRPDNQNKIFIPAVPSGETGYFKVIVPYSLFMEKFAKYKDVFTDPDQQILWIVEGVNNCTSPAAPVAPPTPQLEPVDKPPALLLQEEIPDTPYPKTFEEFKNNLEPIKENEFAIKEQLKQWGLAEHSLAYARDVVTHFKDNNLTKNQWTSTRSSIVASESLEELYEILFPKEESPSFSYYANLPDLRSFSTAGGALQVANSNDNSLSKN